MGQHVIDKIGADPANVKWSVVRGDTATLRVEFLENDESTYVNTSTWLFNSSTYDSRGDALDELEVNVFSGYVDIVANPEITQLWGIGYGYTVAELPFDLEVTIGDTVWTPVVGTISVIADVTSGGL
jgi:hypothetical protein